MFVRLFVDENLDRIIPISKQPKEKIQAIIDSCARQFPEFSDRSRKRIRTYLKSCRRNKKMRDGWDNTVSLMVGNEETPILSHTATNFFVFPQNRPTPAHLTSVQAEQILAIACENESMNAKRMRIGLEPITHAIPAPGSAVAAAVAASTASCGSNSAATITSLPMGGSDGNVAVTSSANTSLPFVSCSGFTRSTPNSETSETQLQLTPGAVVAAAAVANSSALSAVGGSTGGGGSINSARSSPLALSSNASTAGMDIKPLSACLSNGNSGATNGSSNSLGVLTGLPASSPLYNPSNFNAATAAAAAASPFVAAAAAAVAAGRTPTYPSYFPGLGNGECRKLYIYFKSFILKL